MGYILKISWKRGVANFFLHVYYEDKSSVPEKVFLCPLIVKSAVRWVTEAYIAHVMIDAGNRKFILLPFQ